MSNSNSFTIDVPDLPELPDVDSIMKLAIARRDAFQSAVDIAQAEVNKAQKIIDMLNGGSTKSSMTKARQKSVSDTALCRIVTALSNHGYAAARTIASATSYSDSQVRFAMKIAEERGWVTAERRGRYNKFRYSLTDAGVEFVTSEECE